MAVPNFDPNQWYSLFVGNGSQGLVGTSLFKGTTGAVFPTKMNTSAAEQRWQISQLNATAWTLRSKDGGPNGFLGAKWNEYTQSQILPIMIRGDIADASALWTFNLWDDSTLKLSNLANGTENLLQKNPELAISSNAPAPPIGEGWRYKAVGEVNDVRYSSVRLSVTVVPATSSSTVSQSLTSTAAATSTSATTSISPTAVTNAKDDVSSSSGLSPGVKAGIGAAVGIVTLISLVVLGLFFWRKRKHRPAYSHAPPELYAGPGYNDIPPVVKYELNHDETSQYELPSGHLHEAPSYDRPYELSSYVVHR